jgi:hypothetical protein
MQNGFFNRSEYGEAADIEAVTTKIQAFADREGRRPRILVAKMGQVWNGSNPFRSISFRT